MITFIKLSIKKFFSLFGIGFYRISQRDDVNRILSPLLHNSRENANLLYKDSDFIDNYCSEERLCFYNAIKDLLVEKQFNLNDKKILDVGCGSGDLLFVLNKTFSFSSISGLDFSKEAIKIAQSRVSGGRFFVHDIYDSVLEKFDFILCVEVLEHLENPKKALENILSMMEGEAICFLSVPNGRIDTYIGHINFWSPESWKQFLIDTCIEHNVEVGFFSDPRFISNYTFIKNKKL